MASLHAGHARGGVVLSVMLSSAVAAAAPNPDDRSGDLRPEAAAILDATADWGGPFTLGDARTLGLVHAPASFTTPATIRVWRRGLDGSTASCSGQVDVIPFEQYVKGVLPHEWIRSWDVESLKTGAVAIRTYAAWWVQAGGKYSCADLDDTTASQVYKDEFFDNTNAAVDATANQLVVQGGDLVFAEYSAENGDPTDFGVDEPLCAGQTISGHRRGTCQWGSQRWALHGEDYFWILRHYYPGADVANIQPDYSASLGAQQAVTELVSGEEAVVWLEYSNDGNQTWDPSSVFVGTTGPRDRDSAFWKDGNWVSPARPTGADHSGQTPGTTARFSWVMLAPEVTEDTTFTESFGLVTADGTWFGPEDGAVTWTILVHPSSSGGGGGGGGGDDTVDPGGDDAGDGGSGGCNAGGSASGALLPLVLALSFVAVRRRRVLALLALLGACTASEPDRAPAARRPLGGDSALVGIFRDVAATRGVPAELLATISYTNTRLRFVGEYAVADGSHDDHGGPGAIGLLALREDQAARAAALAGLDEAAVHTDDLASVDAAAALLADLAGTPPRDLAGWRAALVAFDGDSFARQVFAHLASGWTGRDAAGATVTLSAVPLAAPDDDGLATVTQGLGYPGAIWNPAYSGNYQASSRGAAQINYVVIHTTQGSYGGTINWFKNPDAQVSSHYVVRSSDGEVTQMVDDSDIAWHDACFNSETIGIEHEGFVADPDVWYTEAMYTESAKLTAWLADSYGIPKTRDYIFGHGEAPDCSDHTDPGPGWNWDHYMDLVVTGGQPQFGADGGSSDYPATMVSGEEGVAWFEFANTSNVTWGLDETRLGTQEPQDRESAFFVDGNWLSPSRATGADHSNYAPGTTGRFTFAIRAPEVTETTTFDEAFQLVQEGVTWFGPIVHMTITVTPVDGGGGGGGGSGDDDPSTDPGGDDDGGTPGTGACSAGGASAPGGALVLLAAALVTRRRRRA